MRNIKLAFRTLLKTPFVTTIAVLSLALGIGANAAIFSLFDQLLLRPLPVRDPGSLVNLSAPGPMPGSNSCNDAGGCDEVFSYAMFRDLEQARATPFTGVAAHRLFGVSIGTRGEPISGRGMMVSGSYFPVLGIRAALGRLLLPDDDKVIGANYVAVVGYRFWKNKLGQDRAVVGKPIVINGKTYTIVGVAPEGFDGTTVGSRPDVYVPISMRGELQGFKRFTERRNYWVYLFARLKPGVSIDAAKASANAIYHPIITDVEAPLQKGMSPTTLEAFRNKKLVLKPGARGQSSVHREAKAPLLMLFSVTGVVLLIACANIANLLLARGAGRATEMGVRLALGGTRRSLVMQLLTESLILAAVGGLVSLVVAQWTLRAIGALLKPEAREMVQLQISVPVAIFAALVSVVTGAAFGLFPALHSTRSDLISAIRAGTRQIAGGRSAARFRFGLVTTQIALSMGLLIMSALFLKSLRNISRVDLGLKYDHVATFTIVPERIGYDSVRSAALLERVEREMAALPGVTAVTGALVPLLAGDNWGNSVRVQGYKCDPDADCSSRFNEIGTGYFATFDVPLVAGREFTDADRAGSQRVAIVNEEFAKKFNMGNDVVGKFMGDGEGDSLNVQIVGLVRNLKYSDVKDSVPAVYYRPWRQDTRVGALNFYVRSSTPPEQLLPTLRATMQRIEPGLPIEDLKTMRQQVQENVFVDRMISVLSSSFAMLATLLAGVGLYGVLAYSVAQRTREIGVRMALGADARGVRGLVMRQVGMMLLVGGVIGIAGALALGRLARSMLFELNGQDPVAVVAAVVVLTGVAAAAGFVPARRAALVDPMSALRYD